MSYLQKTFLKISGVAFLFSILFSQPADAFVMHNQYWFQVMLRYGFDFGKKGAAGRFGVEIDVSPENSDAFFGGTFDVSVDRGYNNELQLMGLGFTFNTGYCINFDAVNAFALPAYIRIGLIDSKIGLVAAGGLQGLIPAHLGWNGNIDMLGTIRLRAPGIGLHYLGDDDVPWFSTGMEIGAGFATPQGEGGGGGYYYYYY